MGRILAFFWIVPTIMVNVFALDAMFIEFGETAIYWKQPLYGLDRLYLLAAYNSFSPISDYFRRYYDIILPQWMSHLLVSYIATASAIAASGMGVAQRDDFVDNARSAGASAIWPVTLVAFLFQAIGLRLVTRFARDHSIAFLAYFIAVGTAYAGMAYINEYVLEKSPEESVASAPPASNRNRQTALL